MADSRPSVTKRGRARRGRSSAPVRPAREGPLANRRIEISTQRGGGSRTPTRPQARPAGDDQQDAQDQLTLDELHDPHDDEDGSDDPQGGCAHWRAYPRARCSIPLGFVPPDPGSGRCGSMSTEPAPTDGGHRSVIAAFLANLGIAIAKLIGFLAT